MVFTVNLLSNYQSLLMVFFSFTVLAKVTANISQVIVARCFETMVFTVNFFSNNQSLLIVFFSFTVLAKVTVKIPATEDRLSLGGYYGAYRLLGFRLSPWPKSVIAAPAATAIFPPKWRCFALVGYLLLLHYYDILPYKVKRKCKIRGRNKL